MKKLFFILTLITYSFGQTAKAQEYQDLLSLWVDQKYDKLAEKAAKYTEKDKTKNDPLPYLYLCKALFRISQDDELKQKEQFKKAETDALSYAVKYKKKDKGGVYKTEAEEFFAEMKNYYFELVRNYMDANNHKKALSILKKVIQFDPENSGAWLSKGVCEFINKNKTEAQKNAASGVEKVKAITNFNDLHEVDQNFLRYSLMAYANYLVSAKDLKTAKEVISLGYQYYSKLKDDVGEDIPENKAYVDLYNQLVN